MECIKVREYYGNTFVREYEAEIKDGLYKEIISETPFVPVLGIIVEQDIRTHACGVYEVTISFIDGRKDKVISQFTDYYKRCNLDSAKERSLEESLSELKRIKLKTGLRVVERITNATNKGFPNWYR